MEDDARRDNVRMLSSKYRQWEVDVKYLESELKRWKNTARDAWLFAVIGWLAFLGVFAAWITNTPVK